MTERLQTLTARGVAGEITPAEKTELNECERLEHLTIITNKAGNLQHSRSEPHTSSKAK